MDNGAKAKEAGRRLISPSVIERWKIYKYKFTRNKLSIFGFILVVISIVLSLFPAQIAPYPEHVGAFIDFGNAAQPPSKDHWFGTDNAGRDVLSRVIFSFRDALIMSVVVLAISVPFGTLLGLIAGYYNGTWIDTLIMRLTDVFLSIPAFILALAIASILEPNMLNSMLAVTVMWWPWYTRITYGEASSISKEYFVRNAELVGASKMHILFREILPNCLSQIFTKMALDVGWVILMGASLSFVGLGVQPPTPAFGQMISDGSKFLPDMWWCTIFPALGVVFMILGFNLFGDGIRDMFDKGGH